MKNLEKKELSTKQIKKLKKEEVNRFKRIRYYSSTEFQLKIYFLFLLIHVIYTMFFIFTFPFIYIDQKGCSIQYFGISKLFILF
jgi:hypothetical protein